MALDTIIKKVHKLLRVKPKTAAELAQSLGYSDGRGISRALAALVASGEAVRVQGGYVRA